MKIKKPMPMMCEVADFNKKKQTPVAFFKNDSGEFVFTLYNISVLLDLDPDQIEDELDCNELDHEHCSLTGATFLPDHVVVRLCLSFGKWDNLWMLVSVRQRYHRYSHYTCNGSVAKYRIKFSKASGIPIEKIWPNKPYEFISRATLAGLTDKEIDTPAHKRREQ